MPEQETSMQPEKNPPFWAKWFTKKPEVNPNREIVDDLINAKAEKASAEMEAAELKRLVELDKMEMFHNPEEAIDFLRLSTAKLWRERTLNQRYGEGVVGWYNKLQAGEYDFSVEETGEIKKVAINKLAEIGRRTLKTIFNRQVAVGTGTAIAAGALTAGTGTAAGFATVIGTVAGRATGEVWESINGQEGKLREDIAVRDYYQWFKCRQTALGIHELQENNAGDKEINQQVAELIDLMYAPAKEVEDLQNQLAETKKKNNNIKLMLGTAGAAAGLGANMLAGGLDKLLHQLDVNGDGIYHWTKEINGKMQFIYNSATEFAKDRFAGIAQWVNLPGGEHAHVIAEKGTGMAQYLWGVGKNIIRDGSVLLATWLASIHGAEAKISGKNAQEVIKDKSFEKENITAIQEQTAKEDFEARLGKEDLDWLVENKYLVDFEMIIPQDQAIIAITNDKLTAGKYIVGGINWQKETVKIKDKEGKTWNIILQFVFDHKDWFGHKSFHAAEDEIGQPKSTKPVAAPVFEDQKMDEDNVAEEEDKKQQIEPGVAKTPEPEKKKSASGESAGSAETKPETKQSTEPKKDKKEKSKPKEEEKQILPKEKLGLLKNTFGEDYPHILKHESVISIQEIKQTGKSKELSKILKDIGYKIYAVYGADNKHEYQGLHLVGKNAIDNKKEFYTFQEPSADQLKEL